MTEFQMCTSVKDLKQRITAAVASVDEDMLSSNLWPLQCS
jgi:hypothetical protein